jgi:hypothetical protein
MPYDWIDVPAGLPQGVMKKLVKLTDKATAAALEQAITSWLFAATDESPATNIIRATVVRLRDWAEAGEDLIATTDPAAIEALIDASEGQGDVVVLVNGLRDSLRVLRNLAEKAASEMPQPKRGRPAHTLDRGFAREVARILRDHGHSCTVTLGINRVGDSKDGGVEDSEDSLLVKILDCIIGVNAYHLARSVKS